MWVAGGGVGVVHRGRAGECESVTYNFDPDRWYEGQRALLTARRDRGELDDTAFTEALEELDRRYEEMLTRLDGSFQLPT
jgi:hypothetical protein